MAFETNFHHLTVSIASLINEQYTLSYLEGAVRHFCFCFSIVASALKLHLLHTFMASHKIGMTLSVNCVELDLLLMCACSQLLTRVVHVVQCVVQCACTIKGIPLSSCATKGIPLSSSYASSTVSRHRAETKTQTPKKLTFVLISNQVCRKIGCLSYSNPYLLPGCFQLSAMSRVSFKFYCFLGASPAIR